MSRSARTPQGPSDSAASSPAPGPAPALEKAYRPAETEPRIRRCWDEAGAFHADPARVLTGEREPYCILIPPPNVTAALHLGHALTYSLQDILTRAHRMMGYETLWMPGTDHAGIATQAVVERRIKEEEGLTRQQLGREEFVQRVQAFKDEYEATITEQLKVIGCSCDWARQRFTMDEQCVAAVREAFFRLFRDGLIYRGKRLVNWDPVLQTAVADDEVEDVEVDGQFYYLRYPVVRGGRDSGTKGPRDKGRIQIPETWGELARRKYPQADDHPPDEQAWVTVATTRPETYLGDTAVAVNPKDPRAAPLKGLMVELPLVGRIIPIIEDEYVVMPAADPETDGVDPKARYATGFLKVTPAHDPNDYELGLRHNLPVINVLAPDASISDKHGWTDVGDAHLFVGKSREAARQLVVREFYARGLLEETRPYRHTVGHSDRSKAVIEPYLSDQWYVKVTDDSMRGAALRAMVAEQRTGEGTEGQRNKRTQGRDGDGALRFHPARYAKMFETWHDNIRDWCISRQLWWGHRIPVWTLDEVKDAGVLKRNLDTLFSRAGLTEDVCIRFDPLPQAHGHICARTEKAEAFLNDLSDLCRPGPVIGPRLPTQPYARSGTPLFDQHHPDLMQEARDVKEGIASLERDPDVLDTWFSSALWPISTMGWPDPATFPGNDGLLEAFNPTSVLCTAREIITLWVSRMVMFNRYFLPESHHRPDATRRGQAATDRTDLSENGQGRGPVPFKDVFIHALIMDGEGRKMSKTLGNGVDPRDIIQSHGADAMRFTLCHMTTQTQDVRMPVVPDPATGQNTSPKFDLGRNLCNKLWNATRFALSKLERPGASAADAGAPVHVSYPDLPLADRWMLSRLSASVAEVNAALKDYQFSVYAQTVYDLLWRDFCDWYLEAIKLTVNANPAQRAVLRAVLDVIVRLLHPITPFVTEAIHEHLRRVPAHRVPGIDLATEALLCRSAWPQVAAGLRDGAAEERFETVRSLVTAIREVRSQHKVAPARRITLHATARIAKACEAAGGLVQTLAVLDTITLQAPKAGVPTVALRVDADELHLSNFADAVDAGAERERLLKIIADRERTISTIDKRLENPGYIAKAPPNLVEESRSQRAAALAELESARAALEKVE